MILILSILIISLFEAADVYIEGISVVSFPLLIFMLSAILLPAKFQVITFIIWMGIALLKEMLLNQAVRREINYINLGLKFIPGALIMIANAIGALRWLLGYPAILTIGLLYLLTNYFILDIKPGNEEKMKLALVLSLIWLLNLITLPVVIYDKFNGGLKLSGMTVTAWVLLSSLIGLLMKYYYNTHIDKLFKQLNQAMNVIRSYRDRLELKEKQIHNLNVELERTRESFSFLSRFHEVVAKNWNLDEVFKQLSILLLKLFEYQNFVLFRYDQDSMTLEPIYYKAAHSTRLKNLKLKVGDTIVGEAVRKMRPILWNQRHIPKLFSTSLKDTMFDQDANITPLFPMDRSAMAVPMSFNNTILGCIYIGHSRLGAYDKHKFNMLTLISYELALIYSFYLEYTKSIDLAIRDGLTGLYTHRYFQERLEEEITKSKRYGAPISLIMMDTDNFKKYNDTYGHPEGDKLLQRIAKYLRETLRESDIICRYGGDEFTIILPNIDKKTAVAIAKRIHANFDKVNLPGREVRVTTSIGVATYPIDATTKDELIKAADTNLYKAKQRGRNTIVAE